MARNDGLDVVRNVQANFRQIELDKMEHERHMLDIRLKYESSNSALKTAMLQIFDKLHCLANPHFTWDIPADGNQIVAEGRKMIKDFFDKTEQSGQGETL
jgi:hypothetical protein